MVFDEVRRAAFPFGVHDDLNVAEVRDGIEGSARECPDGAGDSEHGQDENEEGVAGAGFDDPLEEEGAGSCVGVWACRSVGVVWR